MTLLHFCKRCSLFALMSTFTVMTTSELFQAAEKTLPFSLTLKQTTLLHALSAYVLSHGERDIFILNGYAGTGKTTVIGALVKGMKELNLNSVILAPTGRAAKVASSFAGKNAFTIHKRIFRGNSLDPSNQQFFLASNPDKNTIFIVDEASLISDSSNPNASVLQQLFRHIYSAPGCGVILVGDIAQLPPVGLLQSPAMIPQRLRQLGFNPIEFTLETPLRQAAESGILFNATFIRKALFNDRPFNKFGLIKKNFPDVSIISSEFLSESLEDSWGEVGQEETLIITRSNKRAAQYNSEIRNRILYAEGPLERGERLVISKNDYYWSKINETSAFLANGETVEVNWVGRPEKVYGRWFVDVELKLPESDVPFGAKIMLRSLMAEGPSIPKEEMEKFYNLVLLEYDGELSHKIKGALEDPYYNALQVKYAYCVTCHKAQGGQWKHVYIDLGGVSVEENMTNDFYRWLYTAVTRATDHVYFINPSLKVV